jgi:hypothetical protein
MTDVTVTAVDRASEPKDLAFPFAKQNDALPDYELHLQLRDGGSLNLGAKLNSSASEGLTWHLYEPISVREISTIRDTAQRNLLALEFIMVRLAHRRLLRD